MRRTPAQAARLAMAEALREVEANAAVVLASDAPEGVHQLRVSLRRLRSALRAFRKALAPGFEDRMRPELAWITDVAGVVRDLDVLAISTLPALEKAGGVRRDGGFSRRVARRRASALGRLRRALRSRRYAAMLRAFAPGQDSPVRKAPGDGEDLRRFAARSVKRRFRAVRAAAGDDPATLRPAALHRLRIAVKKLRYGIEAFDAAWPPKAVRPFAESLEKLQAALGRANDAATAAKLLKALDAPRDLAAVAKRWIAKEIGATTESLPHRLAVLEKAPRFFSKRHARARS